MADNQDKKNQKPKNEAKNNNRNKNNRQYQNSQNNRSSENGRKDTKSSNNVDMKKYDRMITAAINNFSDIPCGTLTKECEICYKPNDVFGVGSCRHSICAECAIRLRVLGESKGCPVCRTELDILLFYTVDEDSTTIPIDFEQTGHPDENRFKIRFSNSIAKAKYEKYLAHVCKICKTPEGDRLEFQSFISLRQHMANNHELSYCHICTDNLNLFSRERKTYSRDQLQRHITIGDYDDKSFKGHPECLFCKMRFLDNENRYKHLRKDHFFCQICESNFSQSNNFFGKHEELKRHYNEFHFTCQLDECATLGIAFATEIELNLHKVNEHSNGKRNLIDLGFQSRRGSQLSGPSSSGRGRGRGSTTEVPQKPSSSSRIAVVQRNNETNNPQSDPSQFTVVPSAQSRNSSTVYANYRAAYTPQVQDFPSLVEAPPPPVLKSTEFPRLNKVNKKATPSTVVEDFPSLGASSSSASSKRINVPPLQKKPIVQQPSKNLVSVQQKTSVSSENKKRREVDEDFKPKKEVPQAVVKVNNTLLRFDMVDDRASSSTKSNIQLVTRNDIQPPVQPVKKQEIVSPSSVSDFPALPIASNPITPANTAWQNSKNSKFKGNITSISVPSNYSAITKNTQKNKNKKVKPPVNEVWSNLGRPPTPPEMKTVDDDDWKSAKMTKEDLIEKAKREKREEWARKKAEIQAAVAASSKTKKEEPEKSEKNSSVEKNETKHPIEVVPEPQKDVNKGIDPPNVNKKNKKVKNVKKESIDKIPTETSTETSIESETKKESPVEVAQKVLQDKIDAFWNMSALPSFFNNLSLSNMFASPLSSSTSIPPASSSMEGTSTSIAPPPGLENISLSPPPGLENSNSFASTSFLSHEDVQSKKKEKVIEKVEDNEWVSTKKPKNKKKK